MVDLLRLPMLLVLLLTVSSCTGAATSRSTAFGALPGCEDEVGLIVSPDYSEAALRAAALELGAFGSGARAIMIQEPTQILNERSVARRIEEAYPAHLRELGIQGSVAVAVLAAEDGSPREAYVWRASQHREFDLLAIRFARVLRFASTIHQDCRLRTVRIVPIAFTLVPSS